MLTVHQMLPAIRLAASITETPNPTVADIVLRMMDAAEEEIREYAPGEEEYAPGAPAHVMEESQVRYVGWLYDSNPAGSRQPHVSGFRQSGAQAMLSRWHLPPAV